jgi:hypothetical protein
MSYLAPSIVASGTTFAQWQSGGVSGHLENLITAQVATTAPVTAATVSATGFSTSGGSLAAGGYFLKFTELNGIGETQTAPESAVFTVAAGNQPQVTFPALQTSNTGRNVYLTAAGGATGTEVLYATGVAGTTMKLAIAAPANSFAQAPANENSTGLTYVDTNSNTLNAPLEMLRLFKDGRGDKVFLYVANLIRDFNRGDPASFRGVTLKLRHCHTVFSMLATLCNEAGVLLDANPGTLKPSTNGIGNSKTIRTWP